MKKALITFAIILPFFWNTPAKSTIQKTPHRSVAIWNLPEDLFECFTKTEMYKTVSGWVNKLWPF